MAAAASRYVPEPLNFAVQLLQSAAPLRKTAPSQPQMSFSASDPSARWLAPRPGGSGKESEAAEIQPLEMASVLSKAADDGYFGSPEFKASALAAAMGVVQRAAEVFAGIAALPEAFAPAQSALEDLGRAKALPKVQRLCLFFVMGNASADNSQGGCGGEHGHQVALLTIGSCFKS